MAPRADASASRRTGPGILLPSAQEQLLLTAALAGGDRAISSFRAWREVVDLDGELGWETVGLFPLAYHNLTRLGATDPLLGRLKGVYRRTWYESQQVIHRVSPAIAAMQARGISPLVVDGAALALACYEPATLRPVTGVDLLILRDAVGAAVRALVDHGWRPAEELEDGDLRFADQLRVLGPDGTELRLWWRLLTGGVDAVQSGFPGGDPLPWPGLKLHTLDPGRQLLRTILEGIRPDIRTSYHWVPDALMILRARGGAIDWPAIQAEATACRMTALLGVACGYLVEEFSAPIPAEVLASLRRHRPSLAERIADTALASTPREPMPWPPPPRGSLRGEWNRFLARRRRPGNPAILLVEFSHVLRHRWGLRGRRQLLSLALRAARPSGTRHGTHRLPAQDRHPSPV
jgi:hypothetical protein